MEKRKIFRIVGVVVVLLFIFLIIVANQKDKKKIDNSDNTRKIVEIQETQISDENIQKIKEDLQQNLTDAFATSKQQYEEYEKKNFDIYFDDSYINENMNYGRIDYVSTPLIDSEDPRKIEIYNLDGELLEKFPKEDLEYSKDNEIRANNNYLIRLMDYESDYSFYYIMNINRDCQANLREVCYTKGEERKMEELIINEDV